MEGAIPLVALILGVNLLVALTYGATRYGIAMASCLCLYAAAALDGPVAGGGRASEGLIRGGFAGRDGPNGPPKETGGAANGRPARLCLSHRYRWVRAGAPSEQQEGRHADDGRHGASDGGSHQP